MKVLLHLGFPKSGSSTLQYSVWKPLEKAGKLKLFTWRKNNFNESLSTRPSSSLFNFGNIENDYLDFDKKKINILSDESFTAPVRLRQNNFGTGIDDPINFPSKIKAQIENLFGPDVQIHPLIVFRNHRSLLFSQYVEEYNLKRRKNIEFIFEKDGKTINLSGFNVYRFNEYLTEVEAVFGRRNTSVLFYEQIKYDFTNFCATIAKLSGVEPNFVELAITQNIVNARKKTSRGYFTKDGNTLIPFLDAKQKQAIVNHFSLDTNALVSKYADSIPLLKYGYHFE